MGDGPVVAGNEQSPPDSRSGSRSSVRSTAFVSYSHAVDGKLAPALHTMDELAFTDPRRPGHDQSHRDVTHLAW